MSEGFKLNKRTAVLATALILFFSAFFFRSSLDKIIITLVVGFAYFTGLISLLLGVVSFVLVYAASLPVISTLYAYIAFILAKIHYIVFRAFMDKTMRRMRWYSMLELKVKNSSIVKRVSKILHGFLKDLGLERPRRVKFFEVIACKDCNRDVPIDGAMCPYCGNKIEIEPDSRRAVFKSKYEGFYSQIRDLAEIGELRRLSGYPGHKHFGENKQRLRHSYMVSWLSYKIALRLGLDTRLVARAGLLHDIGYDPDGHGAINQILFHAGRGAGKVREMGEDEKISKIVSQHMSPLGWPPTSLESWTVWLGDKIASVLEFFRMEFLFQGDEAWRKIKKQTQTNQ